ncbi:hypothetical protein [Tamlana sp. s12]|nr:hypothetical protein [Tamlana sp. s12]
MAKWYKKYTFVATVHTTLPIRTASQGVSFAFYKVRLAQNQPYV